ncbi:MAG: hypothetical protein AB7E73_09405, partial [Burkholderiales bacterium]
TTLNANAGYCIDYESAGFPSIKAIQSMREYYEAQGWMFLPVGRPKFFRAIIDQSSIIKCHATMIFTYSTLLNFVRNFAFIFTCLSCMTLGLGTSLAALPAWESGFERGFPGGEWLNFDNGSYSPSGSMPANRSSAWTIVNRNSGEPVHSGSYAYKGWIVAASQHNHRAYPGITINLATPLINTFMVYLDIDHEKMSPTDWIHLGTWGNYDTETKTGNWALHTMSIRNRKLEFAHAKPFFGEYINLGAQPDFPLKKWVRLTVYIIYNGTTGFVQTWQDGQPMLRGRIPQLLKQPGTTLRTAHWGMYASGSVTQGIQYNDDIRICRLNAPLTDFVTEPRCPN